MSSDPGFLLYAVTDRKIVRGGDLAGLLKLLVGNGLKAVQLREKDLSEDELARLAGSLRSVIGRSGVRLLVNSSIRAAVESGAAGVHLPADSGVAPARSALGPDALVGKSVHGAGEAKRAREEGADFVTFGPVYATPSKAAYGPPMGVERLHEVCEITDIPVYAIGGVTPGRVADCLAAGARGVAAVSSLMAAENPVEVLKEYERSLGRL